MAELRWTWVDDVDTSWREALARAFDPAALVPVAGLRPRGIAGRSCGLLAAPPSVPFGVFVKTFAHGSLHARVRHGRGGSGAAVEFDNAVRLHQMGLPVPRPLALADECGLWGCARSHYLMEHIAGAKPLGECLAAAGLPGSPAFDALALAVARLLVDLAAKGVWHRDVNGGNVLVAPDNAGRLRRLYVVDARHVEFGRLPGAPALEQMLTTLAGSLLADGVSDRRVLALASAVPDAAAEHGGGSMRRVSPETTLLLGRRLAAHLVAREVRKGKRPAEALDVFSRRYAGPGDAANYRDRRFARSRYGRKVEAAERRIVEGMLLGLRLRGPVLDAPCGTGRFLPIFAAFSREIVAADTSAEMLALARQESVQAGWPIAYVMADVRRLPVEDRRFELAFAMRLLHRVRGREERLDVLRELARVSRRWVLFSFYDRRSWRGLRDRLRGRYAGETPEVIEAEVAQAGMRVERFYPVGWRGRQTLVLCLKSDVPPQLPARTG